MPNNPEENKEAIKDSKKPNPETRKKVDQTINNVGSTILQKRFGVPKPLANKAVKSNGGKFSPFNTPLAKKGNNAIRNNIAKSIDNRKADQQEKENETINNQEENTNNNSRVGDTTVKNTQQENPTKENNPNSKVNVVANDKAKEEIKKKALSFVIKNPPVLIALIIIPLLVLPILLWIIDGDLIGGKSKVNEDTEVIPPSVNCSQIDFYKTSLSRAEFISRVESYLSGKNSKTAQLFIENAGLIYDTSKIINANPEMIYIIAEKEQGWKDTSWTIKCNNFYGMGVSNGQKTGKCFSSFKESIEYMLGYIQKKGSLDAFVKVYSYLGTYLANPGSSGDGGCYYLKLDDIYGPNYDRCNNSYKCSSSKGGKGCVLTTEAEKQAYIDWQASKILKIRSNIFKLNADSCNVSGGIDGSSDGTTFLNESLESFLSKNNSSLEAFNNKIIDIGCANQGTGQGVAYVAATAVSELASYGKKFHYTYGGLHSSQPNTYGVPGNWGPSGTGPDCSGFVSWALYNAGFTWKSNTATSWGNSGEVVNLGDERVQVGDLIVTPGSRGYNHVVIISAIHQSEGYYNVVEAASTNTGVVFKNVKMDASSPRKAVLMTNYYNSAEKSTAFSNMCSTRRNS